MTIDRGLLGRIRERGEEVLTQVSAELASNPRLAKAVEGAMRGKQKLEEGVGRALRQINVPTRSELKRALSRIESLEREVAELRAKSKSRARPATPRRPAARRAKAKPASSR
jgi:Poly(R)-hydroxyalkanoic acid synthase subunit (PHA_synth_III_E)